MIFSIYIINKAGGLVYNKDYSDGLAKLSANEYLVLAGTFHGVHAITSKISPVPGSSGIEMLESDTFRIHCTQTLTGTKFLLMTDPPQPSIDHIMKKIYEIYSDYCVKNPFHTPEMPIRADLFDAQLLKLVKSVGGLVLSSPTANNPYTVNISNSVVAGQQSSTSSPTPTMVNTGS
ncbi:MAG: Sybindin-like family-domain-containing protein [Benniella sp.]|nr:MAG: Sybindin-like family-domain-containing protein [Benniella sp.]